VPGARRCNGVLGPLTQKWINQFVIWRQAQNVLRPALEDVQRHLMDENNN
jgi:hypothetical protein